MQAFAQRGVIAIRLVAEHRRPGHIPASGALDQIDPQLGLGLKLNLGGDLRLPAALGVLTPLLGQISAHPNGTVPCSPTACTETPIWQLPIFPSVPEYWRLTPGECFRPSGTPCHRTPTPAHRPATRPARPQRAPPAPDPMGSPPRSSASSHSQPRRPASRPSARATYADPARSTPADTPRHSPAAPPFDRPSQHLHAESLQTLPDLRWPLNIHRHHRHPTSQRRKPNARRIRQTSDEPYNKTTKARFVVGFVGGSANLLALVFGARKA